MTEWLTRVLWITCRLLTSVWMTGIIVSRACALRDCFMGLRVMALGRHLAQSPGSSGGIRVRHFCLETMPGRPSLDCGTREVVEFHFSLTPTPKDQLLPNPCSTPSPPPPPSFLFYSTPSYPSLLHLPSSPPQDSSSHFSSLWKLTDAQLCTEIYSYALVCLQLGKWHFAKPRAFSVRMGIKLQFWSGGRIKTLSLVRFTNPGNFHRPCDQINSCWVQFVRKLKRVESYEHFTYYHSREPHRFAASDNLVPKQRLQKNTLFSVSGSQFQCLVLILKLKAVETVVALRNGTRSSTFL